jgi:hypothetical protein
MDANFNLLIGLPKPDFDFGNWVAILDGVVRKILNAPTKTFRAP